MTRDGSTIPIARIFQDIIQKSVMMLPLGAVDDGEHSQNEKINRLADSSEGPVLHHTNPKSPHGNPLTCYILAIEFPSPNLPIYIVGYFALSFAWK